MRVLLVCDNPRVANSVHTALLGDPEVDITEVRTPQRGVALIDEGQQFDIVVGDADTAPTGGFYLAREVKSRVQMGLAMPPVVLFLAREQDQFLSNWSQADAFIIKPVDPFNFREVAQALVGEKPLPALPGVGGDPTPSLLDIPGGDSEDQLDAAAGGLVAGT